MSVDAGDEIVVATYNVHRCRGRDGRYDPSRTARVLAELDADLVGVQEVDSGTDDESRQLAELAERTGYRAVAGPALLRGVVGYGNGVLTRWDIRAVRRFEIGVPGREPRAILDVEVSRGAKHLRALVTHFGLLGRERRLQAEMLARIAAAHPAEQMVVLGDFNEWFPFGRSLGRLARELGSSRALRTFPSRMPLLALDRIWVRPRAALRAVHVHDSTLARTASDHLPVRARLTASCHRGRAEHAPADDVSSRATRS